MKKKIEFLLTIGLWILTIGLLSAQPIDAHFDLIGMEQGLSNDEVTSIQQDKYGFIWIGTRAGLNRYDGKQFRHFRNDPNNLNSLPNNSIECLLTDGKYLWIGTKSGGLSRYDLEKDSFTNFQHDPDNERSLSENRVTSVLVDSKNRKWFGTFNKGINLFHEEDQSFSRFLVNREHVLCLVEDSRGNIWAGTASNLAVFNESKNEFEEVKIFPDRDIEVTKISQDGDFFYLGQWSGSLLKFDISKRKLVKSFDKESFSPVPPEDFWIFEVFRDKSDRLWVGTWGIGLYLFDQEREIFSKVEPFFSRDNSFKLQVILDIFQDRAGTIWLGLDHGGLMSVDEKHAKFKTLNLDIPSLQVLSNLKVWSVMEDSQRNFWLATKGNGVYLNRAGSRKLESFPLPFKNSWKVAFDIMEDQYGNIWMGTDLGIFIVNKNLRIIHEIYPRAHDPTSISGPKTTTLFEDSKGDIWVGTQQHGLNKLLTRKGENFIFKPYQVNPGVEGFLRDYRITCMVEDGNGKLWIGTYDGLHMYHPDRDVFTTFKVHKTKQHSITSNIIINLHIDKQDQLWIGTPNGLNRLDLTVQPYKFEAFFKEDGLPDNYIKAIESDSTGTIWMSTNYGISNFDPKTEEFRNFDLRDGTLSLSFSENSSFTSRDGIMYFGGESGVTAFNPDQISENLFAPEVVFTNFTINNKKVKVDEVINGRKVLDRNLNETDKITLNYQDRMISFEFSALNYTAPRKNRIQYKLEGFDDEWIDANNSRRVTYTALKPGNYLLKIRCSNNSNIWSNQLKELRITVKPPLWKSPPALLFYVIFLVLLLYLIRYLTVARFKLEQDLKLAKAMRTKEKELHELKSEFFTNVSHEIRTPLTLIISPIEEMLTDESISARVREKLTSLHLNASHLLRLVNHILSFRKVEQKRETLEAAKGDFLLFCEEIYLSFKGYADSRKISFIRKKDAGSLELWYDRDKFEIILCNLLLNAFKYTPEGGTVVFDISDKNPGNAVIRIKDTGCGIPKDKQARIFDRFYQVLNGGTAQITGTGVGLSLVKDLVQLHGGQITLNSKLNEGTEFIIKVPKGRSHLEDNQIIKNFLKSDHPDHYIPTNGLTYGPPKAVQEDKQYTILVVEDNADIRRYIRKAFSNQYQVLEADNGRTGLEMANSYLPDLIISDVMMPVLDGISLCRAIKSDLNTNHIPVILLTARTSTLYKIEGLSSGADDYITKPFNLSVLIIRVKNQIAVRENLKERFAKSIKLEPADIEITDLEKNFLAKAVELVETNAGDEDFTAEKLAKAIEMSQSSLYRKLKSLTGLSISGFIKSIRLKMAAQYIRKSDYSIKEVAYLVGFTDARYFRKCFVKQFGVTPSAFRKKEKVPSETE